MCSIIDIKANLLDNDVMDIMTHAQYKPTKEKILARATSYINNNTIHAFGYN